MVEAMFDVTKFLVIADFRAKAFDVGKQAALIGGVHGVLAKMVEVSGRTSHYDSQMLRGADIPVCQICKYVGQTFSSAKYVKRQTGMSAPRSQDQAMTDSTLPFTP